MKLFKDTRKRKRLKIDLLIIYPDLVKGKTFKSENLSAGGVFVETVTPLPVGDKVRLKLPINSAFDPVKVEGRVIWNQPIGQEYRLGNKCPGMGICFENLDKKGKEVLQELLDMTPNYGWFT